MTVSEFVSLWNGLDVSFPNCQNNQCMTLVHRYVSEVLKIEDISVLAKPTAAQVWTEFAWGQYFTQVPNTPTGIPPGGAVMIFKPTADNNNRGHISLVLAGANVNTFNSFDADYPWGTKPHVQGHTYTDANGNDLVYGWLIPNGNLITQDAVSVADPQQIQTLNDAVNSCQSQLKEASGENAILQTDKTNLQQEVSSLEGEVKDGKDQITLLQTQLDGTQKEIINLHATIEAQAKTGVNDSTEIYDLTHANTDLTNYLSATADRLGVDRKNKKSVDIEEAVLAKLDEVDLLLKAAGLGQGLLHQVAKTLSVDAPDDKTAAANIITYVKQFTGNLKNLAQPANPQVNKPSLVNRFIGWFWKSS